MGELTMAYEARCSSTGTRGRTICSARNQHWVADDTGSGGAVGAGELFCASLSACAVNLVGRIATAEGRKVGWMEVNAAAYRDMEKEQGERTLYDAIRIDFEMWGVSEDDAKYLVKTWKQR